MDNGRPHVIVVGGGFGGLNAAKALRRVPVQVTLIDRRNHHLFQPLLYEVATAALSPADISMPLRKVFRRQRNVTVLMGDVIAVDVAHKRLILADEAVGYDFLVLATGATHSYFGHDEWAAQAPGLKTLDDAVEIRRRILLAFEAAEREPDPIRREQWLTFIVVGGGPTGVELAGALAEIARRTLARDFRRCDPASARVVLIEGLPRVLPVYPPELSAKAEEKLRRMGVEVRTGAQVTAVEPGRVRVGNEVIRARTILWGAGVKASPLAQKLGAPLDRNGRVRVDADLTLPGRKDVFVIGDLAAVSSNGRPVPGVAPAAVQMGRHAARCIARALEGRPHEPFHYRDKGLLATIGRAAAVAHIGRFRANGWIAWLLWLVVHIVYLIGFRNRLAVLAGWALKYFRWEPGARLITGEPHPLLLRAPTPATEPEPPRPPPPTPTPQPRA